MPPRTHIVGSILGFLVIYLLSVVTLRPILNRATDGLVEPQRASITAQGIPVRSKYAFCVLLTLREPLFREDENFDDYYFIGTRMLIYQLLHNPETRTNTSIPFVVLVSQDVSEAKRERLRQDGAIVQEAEPIKFDWIKPGRLRWESVMDKLNVFKMVQYEKVLILDSDTVVVRRLDGVFQDPATNFQKNKRMPEKDPADEPKAPDTYIMAANSGPFDANHTYPAKRGNRLNAGFVVLHPSMEMYQYYMGLAAIEDRFPSSSPEQSLWNYAHRWDGNMPWTQVNPDWIANVPTYNDYQHGIASFHEKYWGCARDPPLRDVLLSVRWMMEGFWHHEQKLVSR